MSELVKIASDLANKENIFTILFLFLLFLMIRTVLEYWREEKRKQEEIEYQERKEREQIEIELKILREEREEELKAINKELMMRLEIMTDKQLEITKSLEKLTESVDRLRQEVQDEFFEIYKELAKKADRDEIKGQVIEKLKGVK